jgi:putative membrane protein
MKHVSLFFAAIAVAATLTAAPDKEAPKKTTDMSSPDMAAVLFAANQGEIDQATVAYPKLVDASVRNFAQMMIDEHQRGLTNTTNIMAANKIVAHDAAKDAIELRDKSKQLVTNFRTAQGNFDRNYMVAQVEEHQGLLDLLDNKMIPSSRGDVLTLTQTTRFMVQQHLDRAKVILATLPQAPQP